MYNTRYEDFGSPARNVDELWLIHLMALAEWAEQTLIARHPAIKEFQKSACAYEVYATTKGPHGQYTAGFV